MDESVEEDEELSGTFMCRNCRRSFIVQDGRLVGWATRRAYPQCYDRERNYSGHDFGEARIIAALIELGEALE